MEQSNVNLENIINKVLEQHTTAVTFKSVWKPAAKPKMSTRKRVLIPLVAVLVFNMLFLMGFAYNSFNTFRNIDKIDYPFVDDAAIKGKWETVDFVRCISDFNPESSQCQTETILSSLAFGENGKVLAGMENDNLAEIPCRWTKGMILNDNEKTASKYLLKEINKNQYMFFEWKTGDYIFKKRVPYFYVLKKIDSKDYSNYLPKAVKEDKIDYPFVEDAAMRGKWESVDFVDDIEAFKPGEKSWIDDLFLEKLNFCDNGKLVVTTPSSSDYGKGFTWTKGLIIDKELKAASKCEIKEINGVTYMFYEWKTGDYVYRGRKPSYYVLKKVD